jgi:hypothetical protein
MLKSRNHLDEIVDEESMTEHSYRLMAMRIAERAFRHGVEQAEGAVNGALDKSMQSVLGVNCEGVRPAPAEEKCWKHPYKPPVGVCQIPGCTDPPFKHPVDRRKGERRKGREICPHATEYPCQCFVFARPDGTVYHAVDSRRKDRRRP